MCGGEAADPVSAVSASTQKGAPRKSVSGAFLYGGRHPIGAVRLTFPLLACIWASCVQYTAIELGSVPAAREVRVHITDDGALRLARHLGRISDDVMASVAPQGGDSIALTVWLGRDYPGTRFEDVRETIVFPRGEVTSFRLRRLSPWRTAALSAAAVAGSLLLADRIFQIGDPNRSDGEPPPPPPSNVIPRILLRWFPGGLK